MERFVTGSDGQMHDAALHESAARLHALFPELDPVIFEAFLSIGRTWFALRRVGANYSAAMGLTENQLSTLRLLVLAEANRLSIGEIADLQSTSSTNITKLVNRMQRSGFVRRIADAQDKRVVWVELTSVGRERYIATMPTSRLDREAFEVLTKDEQTALIGMLTRIRARAIALAGEEAADSFLQREDDSGLNRPARASTSRKAAGVG
jgi:DNA-binding MarR family transcriptional regulator